MQNSLQAYLDKQIPASDFAIHYHIGDDFSGETDFQLRGDGTYELWSTVTPGRQHRTYSGQVSLAQVEQLVQELLAAEVWQTKHVRDKPGEDDPEASITIEADGQTFQVVLWVSEIRDSPPFARSQQALLTLVHTVSGGEVLEGGQ